MKEIFEYLKLNCSQSESVLRVTQQQLWFDFNNLQIIIEFTWIKECEYDNFVSISELDYSFFECIKLNKLYIQSLKNALYEEEQEDLENFSACVWVMYQTINKIKLNYPNSIHDFYAKPFCIDDCGYEFGCPEVWVYGFHIEIRDEYWIDKDFISFIINDINIDSCDCLIPDFYNNINSKDSYELRILNSNTKNRRLGYLKILLKMFNEQSKIPVTKANIKFEKYCQTYNEYLEIHKNKKGNVIITKTGNSAKPYIELAINLGLIRKSANIYEIGKKGKVYNILKETLNDSTINPFLFSEFDSNINPFILSKFDISFFLELLLKEDYWFLYTVMEQSAMNSSLTYPILNNEFKNILLKQIRRFIEEAQNNNSKKMLPLKMIEKRINDWKKPEVYMEHVLMSRLNWLYDMDLLDLHSDLSFNLTEKGKRLFYNLTVWNDIALSPIVSPDFFIDNYYMKIIDYMFDIQKREYTKEVNKELLKCLEDTFVLFKTLAPNRITFSLFAHYVKHILFWKHSMIIDTEDIKKLFEQKKILGYIYKYQEHYKDGYIQKSK